MQNCYGVAEVRHPVTTAKLLETSANNFYFVNGRATGDPIYMEATGIENKENPPEQAVDLFNNTYYSASMKNNSNNNKLTIRFKQNGQYISVSPQYMLLSWYGASDKSKTRTYKFKISVLKEKDGEYETLKENGQDKVWEQTVGYEVREQGYDLTNEESSKQAQKIDFTSLGAIYGLRIELDVSSGDGYFALWDVFVDGVTRRRNIIDSTEPLCVEANETGKYKAVRSNNTEYIPIGRCGISGRGVS